MFKVKDTVIDLRTGIKGKVVGISKDGTYPIVVRKPCNTLATYTKTGRYSAIDTHISLFAVVNSLQFFNGGVIIDNHKIVRYSTIEEIRGDTSIVSNKGEVIYVNKEVINDLLKFILNSF